MIRYMRVSMSQICSGYHSGDLPTDILYLVLSWVILGAVDIPDGIVDALLWGHSCVGMNGGLSSLTIPLFALYFARLLNMRREDWVSYPPFNLVVGITFTFCVTDVWLSIPRFREYGILATSYILASLLVISRFYGSGTRRPVLVVESEIQCVVEKIPPTFEIDSTQTTSIPWPPDSRETHSPLSATYTPSSGFDSFMGEKGRLWKYIDKSGAIQGPFSSSKMKVWEMEGYLRGDLLVSEWDTSDFRNFDEIRHTF